MLYRWLLEGPLLWGAHLSWEGASPSHLRSCVLFLISPMSASLGGDATTHLTLTAQSGQEDVHSAASPSPPASLSQNRCSACPAARGGM